MASERPSGSVSGRPSEGRSYVRKGASQKSSREEQERKKEKYILVSFYCSFLGNVVWLYLCPGHSLFLVCLSVHAGDLTLAQCGSAEKEIMDWTPREKSHVRFWFCHHGDSNGGGGGGRNYDIT